MSSDSGALRVRDIVVTAAVASVVSTLVGPLLRKWVEGHEQGDEEPAAEPGPEPEPELSPYVDDFDERMQRLFDGSEGLVEQMTAKRFGRHARARGA